MKPIRALVFLALLSIFSIWASNAQVHCGTVALIPNTSINQVVVFDDFTKYNAGITLNGVARLRIVVEDKAVPDPLCSWSLRMFIENNSGAGTPIDEWEELTTYGNGSGDNPQISALQIRVRNACATSPADNTFQSFSTTADILDIIGQMLPVTPAGSCTQNVNGAGSYLTNYDEFTFNIDIRINPSFQYNPGIFNLNIRFRLEENI